MLVAEQYNFHKNVNCILLCYISAIGGSLTFILAFNFHQTWSYLGRGVSYPTARLTRHRVEFGTSSGLVMVGSGKLQLLILYLFVVRHFEAHRTRGDPTSTGIMASFTSVCTHTGSYSNKYNNNRLNSSAL